MKQTLMQKLLDKIYPILRKITGHKYGCCDRFKECSIWVEELRVQIDLARTFYNPPVRIVGLQKLDEEEDEVEE